MNRLAGKTALVTGSSSGIGQETAIALAKQGARVLVHGRNSARAQEALLKVRDASGRDDVVSVFGDYASLEEVRALAEQVKAHTKTLDLLVHNAGGIFTPRKESKEGHELMFAVNHLAPFLLTLRLRELLLSSASESSPGRVVVVSSMAHKRAQLDLDDLDAKRRFSGMKVYGGSKLANLLFTRALARRLEGKFVTANALHPGVVASSFGRAGDAGKLMDFAMGLARFVLITPAQGAATSIFLASDPGVATHSGEYFIRSKQAKPSRRALDEHFGEALWSASEALVGERWPAA